MTFLAPMMLWSLAALLPLAAFYFLKVRPRRRPTTALFLWEKVWEERRANSLFQRLRDLWSLLLVLLACTAICLALARPEWKGRRQDLLILIDNSASMAANDGSSSRIDEAKKAAAAIVEGLDGTQRAAVATIAQRLIYRSHLTDNPRELLDAVESVAASNQELRLDSLPTRDDEDNRYLRDHRIVLVSDGCFGSGVLPGHIELVKVGTPQGNVGIVAADMAYLPSGADQLGFYCQVASSFAEPREVDLVVANVDEAGNEQPVRVIPLQIAPGTNKPQTYTLDRAAAGKWVARLDLRDALAADNTAYLVASHPDPIRVAVKSEDRYFLENSVLAFSRGDGLMALVRDKPEVVLANGLAPDDGKTIVFHPTGQSCWWKELGEEIEVGAARVMIEEHPVLRYVDVATIPFVGARRIVPPAGAQIMAADERGIPLIYKARSGSRTAVVVNIDPVAADFYFSAWFPVLVHSAATHLAGRENQLSATYRPGDAVPIPAASDESVSALAASAETTSQVRGKWATLDDRLGYSQLSNGSGRWFVSSSLLSAEESLLDNKSAASTTKPLNRGRSPTQWLTLMAIAVLLGESLLYHRRKVG